MITMIQSNLIKYCLGIIYLLVMLENKLLAQKLLLKYFLQIKNAQLILLKSENVRNFF
jgi:hypothetical protein